MRESLGWQTRQAEKVCDVIFTDQRYEYPITSDIGKYTNAQISRPYFLERLSIAIRLKIASRIIIEEIVVGIKDSEKIRYIEICDIKNSEILTREKFYFENDDPSAYSILNEFIKERDREQEWHDQWPYPANLDDRTMQYFDELKNMRPQAAESIERCLSYLK